MESAPLNSAVHACLHVCPTGLSSIFPFILFSVLAKFPSELPPLLFLMVIGWVLLTTLLLEDRVQYCFFLVLSISFCFPFNLFPNWGCVYNWLMWGFLCCTRCRVPIPHREPTHSILIWNIGTGVGHSASQVCSTIL